MGTLAISGTLVSPGRDPFSDGDFDFTAAEARSLKLLSSAFSSVAVEPDADGNGRIDVLEGKFYLPYMGFYVNGTFSGTNLTGAVTMPATFNHFDFCFAASDPGMPTTGVNFTGPSGSGLSNTPATIDTAAGKYCTPAISQMPAGVYTATYNTGQLSFTVPDLSTAPSDTLVVVPTVTLNSNGTMNELTWSYQLGDGTGAGTITPQKLITGMRIYMTDNTTPVANNRYYDSGVLAASSLSHVLTSQTLPWTNVTLIEIDLYTWYDGCIIFYFSKA